MRVVELDRDGIRQRREIRILLEMAAQDVLQRGRTEEEFLAQAQFLAGWRGVGRIEDAREALRLVAFLQRADVIASIEGFEQDGVDRIGGPQA
jgi:hypothetical protein